MRRALVILLLLASQPAIAQTPVAWPGDLVDPGGRGQPADLVLPMPCGAAMAFQKVVVPVDAADPLADRPLRLGQSLDRTGYADYLRRDHLRGAFEDIEAGSTHFYLARYELTVGQYRALQGDCSPPGRGDRIARGGLSWHDGVRLAQNYTTWLYANARDLLPHASGAPGYVRLPSETEWEYAARGGARTDPVGFADLRYFGDGEMRDHARHQAAGSGRGRLGPVGLLQPNQLGLYDIYGNAEELVLTPFRMNALGREHGQLGGVVTRGGSVLSTADQIYSAQRTEYPPHDPATGRPLRGETFGLRLAISAHVATSEARLGAIQRRWAELAGGSVEDDADPAQTLAALIEAETDPRRQRALSDLQLELRRNRQQTQTALAQSARATFLAGAVFVGTLNDSAAEIDTKGASIRTLVALQRAGRKSDLLQRQLRGHVDQLAEMRRLQRVYLLSYRTALETLSSGFSPDQRRIVLDVLREELSLSGQYRLRDAVARFSDDLSRFEQQPDIEADGLLAIALD